VARIDAHLLNRQGVARLCYCGPVLRARADGPQATREPLQFGAEIYGHAGLEADLEVIELALDGLRSIGVAQPVLDLGDARIVRGALAGVVADATRLADVVAALAAKDAGALAALSTGFSAEARDALRSLLSLYGGDEVLAAARRQLPQRALISQALDDLAWLAEQVRRSHPGVRLGFDLADMRGYAYYSGARFAIYAEGAADALVRGGRYDEVGAVFGRNRPAVGFSLDLKALAAVAPAEPPRAAIRAPWGQDEGLRAAIRRLRDGGETVVCALPGHEQESQEYDCDRELVAVDGRWALRAL
jgi:ATP phosphoribosyltransferase regulatory subunit